ncbi:heavy metal sensor histidine kinase [Rhodoferax sp.]|uniref:heavy metal sensor histidine kinase n=1 Tax=Rhodoferax sp. TaxID=50421 RepID=UPI00261EBC41|nr:heavy metal sensor histidine kinase [Rhodoferax sp.]MDD2810531.1 heavy metal sensor histidine kinase [Rhodoferax sp.]MDD4943912.1 heavy metal sensor histidine kinase [Rhodoferax sp.]
MSAFHALRLKALTLAQRLTLLFVAIASAVLLGLGAVVARSVQQHFEDLDMDVLSGKMELITQALQNVATPQDLTGLAHQLARSLVGHHGLEVLLLDADQSVLFATAHASFDPQQVVAQARQALPGAVLWPLEAHTYRVLAARLATAVKDAQGQRAEVFVAAGIDIGHHQAFMQAFLHTLWWFVAGGAVLTAVLSGWAVRRGLAPLLEMRTQAQGITAQQLGHRLHLQHLPVEMAELAQSLNNMLARLEDAFTRLSAFSSDIAHELRTPVSNLMTQTQVALSRARSADDYRNVLESNLEEFERMARMMADMLLLAKADHGLVLPRLETLDMAQEVRTVLDYFEMLAEEKNLSLQLTGDATLMADRLMLRRALSNLISNAVRHAVAGSVIRVELQNLADQLEISVTNQGETIAPEHLERVFDRFFRVDPARQRGHEVAQEGQQEMDSATPQRAGHAVYPAARAEGTGLGLAITRSIVQAHGGRISAQSDHGVTTFSIRQPDL